MLRLAADENFNGDIVRGLLRRNPKLDIVRVQDVGLLSLRLLTHQEIADVLPLPRFLDEAIDVLRLFGEEARRVETLKLEPREYQRIHRFLVSRRRARPASGSNGVSPSLRQRCP